MNWTLVLSIVILLLQALILGFWKPWLGAYGKEKGKNIARKEDLDEILTEVRGVTRAQKEIESELKEGIWNRQMRWNQKRDIYGALLKNSISLLHGYQAVASLMAVSRDPVVIYKKWEELGTVYQDFMQSASLAFIF